MTTAAQPGRKRFRWDELLPVRGKWARWLCLLPLLLVLWVLWGIEVAVPGGAAVDTGWSDWPASLGPAPLVQSTTLLLNPMPNKRVTLAIPAPFHWGIQHSLTLLFGERCFQASIRLPLSQQEVQRRKLSVD
jgi:hypothetical protein